MFLGAYFCEAQMSRVLSRFVISAVFCFFFIGEGSAGLLPAHGDICDNQIVSKKLLANYILEMNDNKVAKKWFLATQSFGVRFLSKSLNNSVPPKRCVAARG